MKFWGYGSEQGKLRSWTLQRTGGESERINREGKKSSKAGF